MCYYRAIIIVLTIISTIMHTQPIDSKERMKTVFSHKKNSCLYWEAIRHMANGDKEAALKVVEKLHHDILAIPTFAWEEDQPDSIDLFFDKLFLTAVERDPEGLSFLGLCESIGIREHKSYLTEISLELMLQELEEKKENLRRLKQYQLDGLSRDQKISYKVFVWKLEQVADEEKFLFHSYTINQMGCFLHMIAHVFTQFHPLEVAEDIDHYIARLNKIPQKFQQVLAFFELQKEKGILPPRFAVERVITMVQKAVPERAEESIFYHQLATNMSKISMHNAEEMLELARHVIERVVTPVYRALEHYLVELLDTTSNNHGVWALPNGDEYYEYALKYHTTTNLSADEIHTIGLQEVERIQKEMRRILATENLNDPRKTVGSLMQDLAKDPRFYYPNTEEARKQCLDDYKAIIERSRKELGHLFGIKPKTGVVVQRIPEHEEGGSAGAYYMRPSMDGSRPGSFYANLRDMSTVPTYGMETLAIHEAEPGHHFQIALQSEMRMPILRKLGSYTAYDEGWALYTEKLAYEHGFYSSSFAILGHLRDELMRAARLVIDTGIHCKRWSREQAIEYMKEITSFHHNEAVSEVERYFVMPGQACAYKIGQLKILELRQRAKEKLGEKFSIQEFHDEVLKVGTVPLAILEEIVETYIQDKLSALSVMETNYQSNTVPS